MIRYTPHLLLNLSIYGQHTLSLCLCCKSSGSLLKGGGVCQQGNVHLEIYGVHSAIGHPKLAQPKCGGQIGSKEPSAQHHSLIRIQMSVCRKELVRSSALAEQHFLIQGLVDLVGQLINGETPSHLSVWRRLTKKLISSVKFT